MIELVFLIIFPVIVALILLLSKNVQLRNVVVKVAAVLIGAGALILLVTYFSRGRVLFSIPFEPATQLMFIIELLIAVFLLYLGIKHRKYIAAILVTIQTLLLIGIEAGLLGDIHPVYNLFIDQFSLIMAAIVGFIGTLICVYALAYMATYHVHHPEVPDRSTK